MNNIYKVIWSKAKNCYVVASEIARSHTKSASGSEKIGGVARHALLALGAACAIACGGFVNVGAAVQRETISPTGTTSNPVLTASNLDDDAHLNTVISVVREDKLVTKDNIAGQLTDYAKASDLSAKADANDVYSKTDAKNTFATKTELGSYATRTELDAKANTDLSNLTADGETKIKNIMSADMEKKANKDTVTALGERVGGVEGKVTTLEGTVGDASGGLVRVVNELKTQGNNLNNELGNKADRTDLDAAKEKITTNETNITALQKKTTGLTDDGKSLNGMNSVETDALTVKGEIKNGAGVITTLTDIKASMDKANANETAIGQLQTTTTNQQTAIDGLNKKTTKITYDASLGTSVDGVTFNAGAVTGVTSINGTEIGMKETGNYISQDGSIWGNMKQVDTQVKTNAEAIAQEKTDREAADIDLSKRIGTVTDDGKYIKKSDTNSVSDNLKVLDTQAKTNADAITETNQRTHGITRDDTKNETSIEGRVTVDTNGNIKAEGTITSNGLNARSGEITTSGKVSAGDVSTGTLETTGDATIGGNLDVKGTLNIKDVTAETIRISKSEDNPVYKSEGSIIGDGGKLSVSNEKFDKRNNITKKSQLNVDEEGTVNWATSTDATGNKTEGRSEVTADNIKNSVKKTEGGKTFGYEENITADGKVGTVTDKEGNTSTTRQDSKGVYGYAKDKDGNKSYTKQEGNRIAESVIGQDGKQTKSEMTSTDITNTAKDGTITNTAKNVTNEGTESVTNKVGTNEVKVSQDGVDIKAEAGKKIKESVGTASRVVENDKITDNAGDSTVTTEKDKGTTFGKAGSTGTTNIYGGSIKTGTINAEDTITDKLTAGAAADAEGGRLTVDADDGIKGSYKSDKYTSKSYILANTLTSGVDNGKKPTDTDFVGSRTDHYMDGDKAKLDETVKDADGSNVTNKTSIGTVTTITDGTNITKTEQGVKDITNTATNGTIKNDARDIVNNASNSITETVGGNNKTEKTADSTKSTIKKGDITTAVKQEGDKIESSIIKDDYSQSNVTTSTVEATANAVTGKDANGNAQTSTVINNKDGLLITNTDNQTSFTTEDRTSTGTAQSWTNIKGNEISTGKVEANYVKMDYADVMKDLGVRGNANITGKTTTGSLEVTGTSTLKGDVTMESNATVKKDLTVEGITTTKTLKVTENATVGGTLDVTQRATFHDAVDIAKDLSVGGNATIAGDVTAKSYKVGDKTYIDANGIHANNQKITNVADGSISEGSKDAVNGGQLYDVKRDMEHKVDKVGANAAAMANLRPMEFDPSSKWNIAAAIGNYGSETAAALGAFYRPNDDVMVNLSTAFGTGENMVGGGVSVRLGKGGNKLSREETNALKAQVADLTARMDALLSVLNPNMSKDFPDVPENHWAYEAVSRLAGNDIVQGYPDGEFHGERTMTRYEMAEIIYNALSRGAEAEKELVEEFKPELQAMAASEKATAERAEG